MTNSPNLARTVPTLGRAQLEYKIRDDVQALDVFSGGFVKVLSRTTDAQPGSPSNGDAYIMTAAASGSAWAGQAEHTLAYWLTDAAAWQFAAPREGLAAYVVDEARALVWDGSSYIAGVAREAGFAIAIDGGGVAITTGVKHYVEVPIGMVVTGWTLFADQAGDLVIDLWTDNYGNFPPTIADTITGSEKPTLSAAQKNQDLTLSTWTTSIAQGDVLAVNVDSAATVTKAWLTVRGVRTN